MQKGLWREKGLELRRGNRKGWGNPGRCLWSLGRGLARKHKAPPPRERSQGPGTCPPSLPTSLGKANLPASRAHPPTPIPKQEHLYGDLE